MLIITITKILATTTNNKNSKAIIKNVDNKINNIKNLQKEKKTTNCNKKFTFMIILFLYLGKEIYITHNNNTILIYSQVRPSEATMGQGAERCSYYLFKENILHYLGLGQASEAPQATMGAERCGQDGLGGRALRLGQARGSSLGLSLV